MNDQTKQCLSETSDTATRALDCLEDLALEKGLDALSMREVAARAGISLASLQYHFSNKAALLDVFVARTTGRLSDTIEKLLKSSAGPAKLPVFARYMLDETSDGREAALIAMIWARSLHNEGARGSLRDLMALYLEGVRDVVLADYPHLKKSDASVAATLIVSMIEGSATTFPAAKTSTEGKKNLDAAVKIMTEIPVRLNS